MLPDVQRAPDRSDKFEFDYPIALVVLGICTAAAIFLRSRVAITNIAMLHLLGTIVVSVTCRRAVAVLSALAGVASFYYFSVPPWNSFVLEDYSYIVILVTTLTVSLVITTLTVKIRAQTDRALDRESTGASDVSIEPRPFIRNGCSGRNSNRSANHRRNI